MARYEHPSEWNEFDKHVKKSAEQQSFFEDEMLFEPAMYEITIELNGKNNEKALTYILANFFLMKDKELKVAKGQAKKELKIACKSYTKDVAETKMVQVMDYIRSHEHPFKCAMVKKKD